MANNATEKQIKFIRSLLEERDQEAVQHLVEDFRESWSQGACTPAYASRFIDRVKEVPRKAQPMAQPGYYVLGEGDEAQFFVVVKTKDGERTYAKRLERRDTGQVRKDGTAIYSGKWAYAPGVAGRELADLKPLTIADVESFGYLWGMCVVCGRALKDPESVKASIGPVCRKKI